MPNTTPSVARGTHRMRILWVAEDRVCRVIKQPVFTICDTFSEEEPMDARTLLLIVSISGLVLIIGFVLFSRHRASRRFNRSVDATITKIQVEAGSISS